MTEAAENPQDKDRYLEIDNLPNRITIFRVLMVPVVIGCLMAITSGYLPAQHDLLGWIAGWSFTLAAITDFFDGHIARKRNIVTVFGSFLDPIADKFLVVSSLIMLLALERVSLVVVIILVLREIYMTSLRLLAQTEGISVPVNSLGKWKTATQMTGIPMIMADAPLFGIPVQIIGPICIYIATFLSAYSAFTYTLGSIKKLKERRTKIRKEKKLAKLKTQEVKGQV